MRYTAVVITLFVTLGLFAQSDTNKNDSNGKRHGLWKGTYEGSKRPRYEGTFDHGKETGVFKFFDDTKAGSVIATRDFTAKDGSCYTVFFDQKGNKVSEGKEVNKQREGEWKLYHKGAKTLMSSENYVKGKLEGVVKVYYPDGKTLAEETGYTNGIKDGVYKKYSPKGVLLEEATYVKGDFEGVATYYYANGEVYATGIYKNGKKKGMWKFYENKKLVEEVNMDKPLKKNLKLSQ